MNPAMRCDAVRSVSAASRVDSDRALSYTDAAAEESISRTVMSVTHLSRNTGLDLVRATEAAAISAGRWMGLGQQSEANAAAEHAMATTLDLLDFDGCIVVGEEGRLKTQSTLVSGRRVGRGGLPVDVVVDPVDGLRLLAQGRSGAISVAAVAPRGALWSPAPAAYMEKLVVSRETAHALVPECLGAPAGWTLALIARILGKDIRDLVVFVLDRPRHVDLVNEIRAAGARVMLADDGDIAGAVLAAMPGGPVDVLMGVGGAPRASSLHVQFGRSAALCLPVLRLRAPMSARRLNSAVSISDRCLPAMIWWRPMRSSLSLPALPMVCCSTVCATSATAPRPIRLSCAAKHVLVGLSTPTTCSLMSRPC